MTKVEIKKKLRLGKLRSQDDHPNQIQSYAMPSYKHQNVSFHSYNFILNYYYYRSKAFSFFSRSQYTTSHISSSASNWGSWIHLLTMLRSSDINSTTPSYSQPVPYLQGRNHFSCQETLDLLFRILAPLTYLRKLLTRNYTFSMGSFVCTPPL